MANSLKAHWAQENRRRQQLPREEILRLAAVQIERRLAWGKSGEKKPRLRIFDAASPGGIRYILHVGRYFIRARSWERVLHRAAFGPWTKKAAEYSAKRAPRPPCTKTTAKIRHASSDQPMLLTQVKRDEKGRVVSGYVENGDWWLSADHEGQTFWSDEHPEQKTCMANFRGWDR